MEFSQAPYFSIQIIRSWQKPRAPIQRNQPKNPKKNALKLFLAEKFTTALEEIKDHWTPQKFESRIKKAIKLFSDGKAPQKKKAKKTEEPRTEA